MDLARWMTTRGVQGPIVSAALYSRWLLYTSLTNQTRRNPNLFVVGATTEDLFETTALAMREYGHARDVAVFLSTGDPAESNVLDVARSIYGSQTTYNYTLPRTPTFQFFLRADQQRPTLPCTAYSCRRRLGGL